MQKFSNIPVAPAQLPDYREASVNPVAPAFLPYRLLTTAAFWMFLAGLSTLPGLSALIGFGPRWLTILALCAGLWFMMIAWLDARHRGWALREHDLIYRYGVLWRTVAIVPFARIQHVETSNGPLERVFGLMRLKCFTAGGAASDLSVRGLDAASAQKVRQYLLEQIRDDVVSNEDRAREEPAANAPD